MAKPKTLQERKKFWVDSWQSCTVMINSPANAVHRLVFPANSAWTVCIVIPITWACCVQSSAVLLHNHTSDCGGRKILLLDNRRKRKSVHAVVDTTMMIPCFKVIRVLSLFLFEFTISWLLLITNHSSNQRKLWQPVAQKDTETCCHDEHWWLFACGGRKHPLTSMTSSADGSSHNKCFATADDSSSLLRRSYLPIYL